MLLHLQRYSVLEEKEIWVKNTSTRREGNMK